MSYSTTGRDGCPLCDKPVMGRTALVGHLEFGHDIADPEAYLAELERPASSGRRSRAGTGRRAVRALGAVALLAALVAGGVLASRELPADGTSDVAADDRADDRTDGGATATTVAPTTSTTGTSPQTTAPTTTAPPTTTTTTTEPADDLAFRAPFLLDAEVTGCTRRGGVDVHEFSFRFSGALNITFDGTFHPDDTGNGPRSSTHELPAGTSTYLDEVVVLDPQGGEHDVEISPPLHLGGC